MRRRSRECRVDQARMRGHAAPPRLARAGHVARRQNSADDPPLRRRERRRGVLALLGMAGQAADSCKACSHASQVRCICDKHLRGSSKVDCLSRPLRASGLRRSAFAHRSRLLPRAERSHLVTRTPTGRSALLCVALIMLVSVTAATAAPRNPTRPNDRGGALGVGVTATTGDHVRPNDRAAIHGAGK